MWRVLAQQIGHPNLKVMQFNEQLFSTQREQYGRPQPLIKVYLPMINTNLFINLGII